MLGTILAVLAIAMAVFIAMAKMKTSTFSATLLAVFGALAYFLWSMGLPMGALWAGLIGGALVLGVNS